MCRILLATAAEPFDPAPLVAEFAAMCAASPVFQGHGWGAAWLTGAGWRLHHAPDPVWEQPALPVDRVRHLLVHARSAFRDEGIAVENNMPFAAGDEVFVFNGELHGVRLSVPGRIGAERIFNLTRNLGPARARDVLLARTRRVLGMNWITVDRRRAVLSAYPGEDAGYYTLHAADSATFRAVCSRPLPSIREWRPIEPGIKEVSLCTSSRSAAATS